MVQYNRDGKDNWRKNLSTKRIYTICQNKRRNINDGKRLGFVQDVCADLETGMITSIIVPGSNKILNIFSQNNDIVIPWQNIKCIGEDLILVEI